MATKDEKTVEVELLADGIRLDGVDYVRGDTVTLPESHAKVLQKHGSVGPKGTIEKLEQAKRDRDEAEARHQRYLSGQGELDADSTEPKDDQPSSSSSRPGPRSTGSK